MPRRRRRSSTLRARSLKSRLPIGISSRRGATWRFKRKRSRKRSRSSRATFGWRGAARWPRSKRSSRRRRSRTLRITSSRRCRRFRSFRLQLKSLVVADPATPSGRPTSCPRRRSEQLPSAGDLAQIIAEGRRNRPEVRQAEDKRLAADIDRSFAANQSLPQADVQVQYLSNGFAGPPYAGPGHSCSANVPTLRA
jgi:hypothetical protein